MAVFDTTLRDEKPLVLSSRESFQISIIRHGALCP
jgi:hypothetical protein